LSDWRATKEGEAKEAATMTTLPVLNVPTSCAGRGGACCRTQCSTPPAAANLICGDCLEVVASLPPAVCIFADPPDNIGQDYDGVTDRRIREEYQAWLAKCLRLFTTKADVVWLSFNARWTFDVGAMFDRLLREDATLRAKPCQQIFTFGQHRHGDLGNNHRPLYRIMREDARLYPDAIRVESWRQENGDKRADPRGRVPGDVFNFPRVTGNSRQRRGWHPTQLHEGLVQRCLLMSTAEGETVIDPFGGTGTTLRVCKRINRPCTLVELSEAYCRAIAAEHGLKIHVVTAAAALRSTTETSRLEFEPFKTQANAS
jgi:site-specific DNA-methyltransferase (adenine-specific)